MSGTAGQGKDTTGRRNVWMDWTQMKMDSVAVVTSIENSSNEKFPAGFSIACSSTPASLHWDFVKTGLIVMQTLLKLFHWKFEITI